MKFENMHPADQLVALMARIYEYGLTTTSGGNLSIKDENGDIWITPSAIDKGSLTRADIIRVKPDGTIIGPHKPSIELPFHTDIYRVRPDIHAVVHAHPANMVAFSLVRRAPEICLIPDTLRICGEVALAGYEIPGSDELRRNITAGFEAGYNTVLMSNHGAVCGADTLIRAFMLFETINSGAALELQARKLGAPRALKREQIENAGFTPELGVLEAAVPGSDERAARRDLSAMVRRACRQRLFTSIQGSFSARLADGSMLITPDGVDRLHMDEDDLVRVKDGCCEAGKTPDVTALLHAEIYRKNPAVGSVIIAQPKSVMAYAVTGTELDVRVLPESYVFLRNPVTLPFGAADRDPAGVAAMFCERTPAILVENQYAILTGVSLIKAFDCLEVLEYSAEAMISAGGVGEIVYLNETEIEVLNRNYNLT